MQATLPRTSLLLLGVLLGGPLGCGMGEGSRPAAGPATAPARVAAGSSYRAPPPDAATRDRAAIAAACRQEAERIIVRQDRGQLMREDERDNRLGSEFNLFANRSEMDRLGRRYELQRMTEDCVRDNTRAVPQAAPADAPPAAPAPVAAPARARR